MVELRSSAGSEGRTIPEDETQEEEERQTSGQTRSPVEEDPRDISGGQIGGGQSDGGNGGTGGGDTSGGSDDPFDAPTGSDVRDRSDRVTDDVDGNGEGDGREPDPFDAPTGSDVRDRQDRVSQADATTADVETDRGGDPFEGRTSGADVMADQGVDVTALPQGAERRGAGGEPPKLVDDPTDAGSQSGEVGRDVPGVEGQGDETGGNFARNRRAREIEQQILEENPELSAEDIAINIDGFGNVDVETTKAFHRKQRQQSEQQVKQELLEGRPGFDESDVVVEETDDGELVARFRSDAQQELQAEAEGRFRGRRRAVAEDTGEDPLVAEARERTTIALRGLGFEGAGDNLRAPDAPGSDTLQEQQAQADLNRALEGLGFEGTGANFRAPEAAGAETLVEQRAAAAARRASPGAPVNPQTAEAILQEGVDANPTVEGTVRVDRQTGDVEFDRREQARFGKIDFSEATGLDTFIGGDPDVDEVSVGFSRFGEVGSEAVANIGLVALLRGQAERRIDAEEEIFPDERFFQRQLVSGLGIVEEIPRAPSFALEGIELAAEGGRALGETGGRALRAVTARDYDIGEIVRPTENFAGAVGEASLFVGQRGVESAREDPEGALAGVGAAVGTGIVGGVALRGVRAGSGSLRATATTTRSPVSVSLRRRPDSGVVAVETGLVRDIRQFLDRVTPESGSSSLSGPELGLPAATAAGSEGLLLGAVRTAKSAPTAVRSAGARVRPDLELSSLRGRVLGRADGGAPPLVAGNRVGPELGLPAATAAGSEGVTAGVTRGIRSVQEAARSAPATVRSAPGAVRATGARAQPGLELSRVRGRLLGRSNGGASPLVAGNRVGPELGLPAATAAGSEGVLLGAVRGVRTLPDARDRIPGRGDVTNFLGDLSDLTLVIERPERKMGTHEVTRTVPLSEAVLGESALAREISDFLGDTRAMAGGGRRRRGKDEDTPDADADEAIEGEEIEGLITRESAEADPEDITPEEFAEQTLFKEGSEEIETALTRFFDEQVRIPERENPFDTRGATAEERLPPQSAFESEAAYQRELEAMRTRIAAEKQASQSVGETIETVVGQELTAESMFAPQGQALEGSMFAERSGAGLVTAASALAPTATATEASMFVDDVQETAVTAATADQASEQLESTISVAHGQLLAAAQDQDQTEMADLAAAQTADLGDDLSLGVGLTTTLDMAPMLDLTPDLGVATGQPIDLTWAEGTSTPPPTRTPGTKPPKPPLPIHLPSGGGGGGGPEFGFGEFQFKVDVGAVGDVLGSDGSDASYDGGVIDFDD